MGCLSELKPSGLIPDYLIMETIIREGGREGADLMKDAHEEIKG